MMDWKLLVVRLGACAAAIRLAWRETPRLLAEWDRVEKPTPLDFEPYEDGGWKVTWDSTNQQATQGMVTFLCSRNDSEA